MADRVRSLALNGQLRGAEIGVDRGELSGYLLAELPNLHLTLVDTWSLFAADSEYAKSGDDINLRTQAQRDADLAETLRVTNYNPVRTNLCRMRSDEAARHVADGALDFVFIDADHSYEGISTDIRLWAPKIRSGGILCGHDYMHEYYPQWGIARAVKEFAYKMGKTVERGADWTWFINI